MNDTEKRAHDLAIAAAAVTAYVNFKTESSGRDPEERRESFARYFHDEYSYFLNHFSKNLE